MTVLGITDLMCNARLDKHNSFRCHGNLDKVLGPTGDLATVSGKLPLLRQHLVIWASTPLGEDIDPLCGCILHQYDFAPATRENYALLEMELKTNLRYNFPDWSISNVRVLAAYDDLTETHGASVSALFSDPDEAVRVGFFCTSEDLALLWAKNRRSLGSWAYISGAKQ